jgi:hypothetical protein
MIKMPVSLLTKSQIVSQMKVPKFFKKWSIFSKDNNSSIDEASNENDGSMSENPKYPN